MSRRRCLKAKPWAPACSSIPLRSDSNWGIGDFGDLKKMLASVGERGGAFIGLNPIHAPSGQPGKHQPVQPVVPSLAERDLHRR